MLRRKNRLLPLILSIISFLLLLALIFFTSPATQLGIAGLQFSLVTFFFLLVFLFCFFTGWYFFHSKLQGGLIGLFVCSFFLFRFNNLTHPFFFILLASLFLTLELLFTYRK